MKFDGRKYKMREEKKTRSDVMKFEHDNIIVKAENYEQTEGV